MISTHIRTEGLYVKTTIIHQLKRLCVPDCAYTENMFINSIHISLRDISLTQNMSYQIKLEQLERLRPEDTPAASWLPMAKESCWIPQVKIRSNDLEDIGQGQRSWHATHLLMLVIICTTYGKNPSRTVDATEGTRFSRLRPNDLENIGQGQRSLHATHPLMLMMICAKYGKNPSRTVDFFSRSRSKNLPKIQIYRFCKKNRNTRYTL